MLDVGLAVDRPELELVVAQAERSAPVLPLDAGKADFFLTTAPITGDVDPLGARVRYQPFEPMAVLRQRFPGEPGYARRRERLGAENLLERQRFVVEASPSDMVVDDFVESLDNVHAVFSEAVCLSMLAVILSKSSTARRSSERRRPANAIDPAVTTASLIGRCRARPFAVR